MELKAEQDKIVKLQTYEGENYSVNDGTQHYLTLQLLYYTLKRLGNIQTIVSGTSKGLWIKKLATPTTTDNSLSPSIKYYRDSNFYLKFKGSCLKQRNTTFTSPNTITFFIVYELDTWSRHLTPTLL